jgi:hypothetical protein
MLHECQPAFRGLTDVGFWDKSHGSDIDVMLGLRLSFQQVVVANEILDGADVIRQLLGE